MACMAAGDASRPAASRVSCMAEPKAKTKKPAKAKKAKAPQKCGSDWKNTQSPGMSHPSGLYYLPYVPDKKADDYDYNFGNFVKDTSKKGVGSRNKTATWDLDDNWKGDFR